MPTPERVLEYIVKDAKAQNIDTIGNLWVLIYDTYAEHCISDDELDIICEELNIKQS